MKSKYLVCYDICSPRRLTKVFKAARSIGIHLQYSVFLCSFTWQELQDFKTKLSRIIEPDEDDIRIYPMPDGEKTIEMGMGRRVPAGVEIFT